MYINSTGYYIPHKRITNQYFSEISGMSEDWYFKRTGILSRSRATDEETINYMSIEAVKNAAKGLSYRVEDVDLIIFASYTPCDTIATTAHVIQREFDIRDAKVFYLSSACSSSMNAMEIIKSFFSTSIATKALLVCSDRNSSYSNDHDQQSGHLWGDAATAFFFSAEAIAGKAIEILGVDSRGLAHIGHGPQGVNLAPKENGLQMPYGRDVFTYACKYITDSTRDILDIYGYSVSDLSYFIGHQANMKILSHVCNELKLKDGVSLTNLSELGNTGCASALLVFAQNYEKFKIDDLICISVFGGGYSTGTCLLKIH